MRTEVSIPFKRERLSELQVKRDCFQQELPAGFNSRSNGFRLSEQYTFRTLSHVQAKLVKYQTRRFLRLF